MTAGIMGTGDVIQGAIDGHIDALQLIKCLSTTIPDQDALYHAIVRVSASGDIARQRGFARTLQKVLEHLGGVS